MDKTLKRTMIVGIGLAMVLASCGGEGAETTTTGASVTSSQPGNDATTTTGPSDDQGDAPELAGEYTVTRYYTPEFNGAINLWDDTEITLVIGSDGTLSGNAGCNDYTGTYEVSGPYVTEQGIDNDLGQAMTVTQLTWTEMACDDQLTMDQEAEYLDALQNVDLWWVGETSGDDPNALHLFSLEDALQVQASRDG